MSPTQTPKINEEENHKLSFPQGFLWGCATSHFQIEGFPDEIQNRLSDWANWTNDKSRIADQTSADEACQFYQRHLDDLALIEELGLKAFRISFNWPALMMGQKGQLAFSSRRKCSEVLQTIFGWFKKAGRQGLCYAISLYPA